jgi:hypothetical protein
VPHEIVSDVPHEIVSDDTNGVPLCPELNAGTLQPGRSATVTMRETAMACAFHDHLAPEDERWQGVVRADAQLKGILESSTP